jgi:hypothetical protein
MFKCSNDQMHARPGSLGDAQAEQLKKKGLALCGCGSKSLSYLEQRVVTSWIYEEIAIFETHLPG